MSRKGKIIPPQGGSGTAPPSATPRVADSERTCSDCRHWKIVSDGNGECRESPPSIVIAPGPFVGYGLTKASNPACSRIALK